VLKLLFTIRDLPDLLAVSFVILVQSACAWLVLRESAAWGWKGARAAILSVWTVSAAVLVLAFLLDFSRVEKLFPEWVLGWGRGLAVLWAFLSVLLCASYALGWALERAAGRGSQPDSARRRFLGAVRVAILGVPAAAVGYGTFVLRHRLTMREQDIRIPGLPADLEGLKIAQLTDIHMGPFLGVHELDRAVAMANETHPHVTLVTGDLITMHGDPLDDCLRSLTRLKADAGIYGCMGNHEIYAGSEEYTQSEGARLGMTFLRRQSQVLRFGAARLNLAGMDYQRLGKHYLQGAEALLVPGAFNVLLQHNPDVFPVAAAKGFPLTIAGHTHGGQVRVEILGADLNISRFYTPYVDGLYQKDGSSIFVSRGIGTIALPTRLGSPPEVALIKLCRI
jgi:predicted MPP superfamily phosphohydrolase